jgi:Xaa-Pro aminopeptidase
MQAGYLFIPTKGESTFYVRRSVGRAIEEADCSVKPIGSFRQFEQTLLTDYPELNSADALRIFTEFDVLPVATYQKLVRVLPNLAIEDGSTLLRKVRMLKSKEEVAHIQQAARVVDEALQASLSRLQAGITEIDWMHVIEQELRSRGHLGVMRMRGYNQEIITGMVAAGKSAATPTYFDGPAGGQGLHPAAPQGSSHRKGYAHFGRHRLLYRRLCH